jgi:hypothetical protein
MGNTEPIESKYTFINKVGKSVISYVFVSEGILSNLVDFRIGNEASYAIVSQNRKYNGEN